MLLKKLNVILASYYEVFRYFSFFKIVFYILSLSQNTFSIIELNAFDDHISCSN